MGLETGTTISQLDSSWPLGSDQKAQGDDHLRLIKAVLKAQFPGVGGQGFNTPITAKEADLNALPQLLLSRSAFRVTKNAQQLISVANQDTLVLFQQVDFDNKTLFETNSYVIPASSDGFWLFGISLKLLHQPPNSIVGVLTTSLLKNGLKVATKITPLAASLSILLVSPQITNVGEIFNVSVNCTSSQYSIEPGTGPFFESCFWGFKVI